MESAPWLLLGPAPMGKRARAGARCPRLVMRGLDPRIHLLWPLESSASSAPRVTAFSTAAEFARRELFRRRLHLIVEVNVILLVQRLVTVEAGAEIGAGVHALVCLEGLVLPLAVAHVVGVLGAPARALFH